MDKPIVLLISGKAEYGKDTFAETFKNQAYERFGFRILTIKYGDILKHVCKEYFAWNGKKDEKGREILQYVGTDLARKNNQDVWVNCVKEIVKGLQTACDFVLISDVRFPNELEWGDTPFITYSIRINRQNEDGTPYENHLTNEQRLHPSETALDNFNFNYEVYNKNITDLDAAAELILEDILRLDMKGNA